MFIFNLFFYAQLLHFWNTEQLSSTVEHFMPYIIISYVIIPYFTPVEQQVILNEFNSLINGVPIRLNQIICLLHSMFYAVFKCFIKFIFRLFMKFITVMSHKCLSIFSVIPSYTVNIKDKKYWKLLKCDSQVIFVI